MKLFESNFDNTIPVEMRRNIFRGKNLGSVYTEEQKEAIRTGTFKDLYIGDYWTDSGVVWRIADMDYFWKTWAMVPTDSDIPREAHHIVIIPDNSLFTSKMYNTDSNTGGFANSLVMAGGMGLGRFQNFFGENNIVVFKDIYTNAVDSSGNITGITTIPGSISIPNQIQLFGNRILYALSVTGMSMNQTYSSLQFSLMKLSPYYIQPPKTAYYWTKDVASSNAFIALSGRSTFPTKCSIDKGVRPYALITG